MVARQQARPARGTLRHAPNPSLRGPQPPRPTPTRHARDQRPRTGPPPRAGTSQFLRRARRRPKPSRAPRSRRTQRQILSSLPRRARARAKARRRGPIPSPKRRRVRRPSPGQPSRVRGSNPERLKTRHRTPRTGRIGPARPGRPVSPSRPRLAQARNPSPAHSKSTGRALKPRRPRSNPRRATPPRVTASPRPANRGPSNPRTERASARRVCRILLSRRGQVPPQGNRTLLRRASLVTRLHLRGHRRAAQRPASVRCPRTNAAPRTRRTRPSERRASDPTRRPRSDRPRSPPARVRTTLPRTSLLPTRAVPSRVNPTLARARRPARKGSIAWRDNCRTWPPGRPSPATPGTRPSSSASRPSASWRTPRPRIASV